MITEIIQVELMCDRIIYYKSKTKSPGWTCIAIALMYVLSNIQRTGKAFF